MTRTSGERRSQFVGFWSGIAAAFGIAAVSAHLGTLTVPIALFGAAYAAVMAAGAAKIDRAWLIIDRAFPNGGDR